MNEPMERGKGLERRRRTISRAYGITLEVGVGTGRNLGLYPSLVSLTATDVSPRMLERAKHRAEGLAIRPVFKLADVQELPYADATFDTVVETCVFCSVANPHRGLLELRRVTRPDGQILLMEHVRPSNPALGRMADVASVFTTRLMGPAVNRRTEETVAAAGIQVVERRAERVWREIVARP